MSAMSSGSPQGAAPDPAVGQADFGANEWLVDELYQKYLADPGSVDRAWWSFFADYQPSLPNGTGPQPVLGVQAAAPAPPAAPPQSPQSPQSPRPPVTAAPPAAPAVAPVTP